VRLASKPDAIIVNKGKYRHFFNRVGKTQLTSKRHNNAFALNSLLIEGI
jgi:hypothetical protein